MKSIAIAIVFLVVVFVVAVAIMFAIALGIIIAYEYITKKGVSGGNKSNASDFDSVGNSNNG